MKRKITNGILYALAFIWCAITILPLLITVLSSFKNNDEIYLGMFEFPNYGVFPTMRQQLRLQMPWLLSETLC